MNLYQRAYNLVVLPALLGGFHVLSPFLSKVKSGFAGRRDLVERVAGWRERVGDRKLVLFHCASAGEFESLRPLAEEFDRSRIMLGVSFFSPSAKRAALQADEFECADFSPIDTHDRVMSYLDLVRPDAVAITKHDVWPNFLWEVSRRGIPSFLINGNFHPKSLRMAPGSRALHRPVYNLFTGILTVSDADSERAVALCGRSEHIQTVGDSRYDRVLTRADRRVELPETLRRYAQDRPILLAGSTHKDDEHLLLPILKKLQGSVGNVGTIIVPHDPSPAARRRIESACREFRLTHEDLDDTRTHDADVMIVNRGGILADLYALGDLAYVGGGFGKGVHSVLEPMAHRLPVICGPNISVSNEANVAKSEALLVTVKGRQQVLRILSEWLKAGEENEQRALIARRFVESRAGASREIARRIQEAMAVES